MPSIQKLRRKGGARWRVKYRFPWDPTRKAYYLGPFDTRREADDARAKLQVELGRARAHHGQLAPGITVSEYGKLWLESAGVKPKTLDSYRSSFTLHIEPLLGQVPVRDVTQGDVLHLLEVKLQEQIRPRPRKPKVYKRNFSKPRTPPPPASPAESRTLSLSTVRIIYGTLRRLL